MRKGLSLLLVLVLFAATLMGCDGHGEPDAAADMNTEVTGEIYDTGEFRVLVPDGWAAFPVADVFSDEPGAIKTSCVIIIKNGTSDRDVHSKPYIRLDCFESDNRMLEHSREGLTSVEDVTPMELGDYTWSGFTGEDHFGGYGKPVIGKMAVLWTQEDGIQYEATIRLEFNGQKEKISPEGRDVQALLASVESSESKTQTK